MAKALVRIVTCAALTLALWSVTTGSSEGDPVQATVDRPATIVAQLSPSPSESRSGSSAHVIIAVTHYSPTDDGMPVEVVVTGRIGNGPEREVGRFGITPDVEFKVDDPSAAQRFSLRLPRELTSTEPIEFSVQIVPVRGSGRGASVQVSDVEIR
jgi:hypothetical protein